MARMNFRIGIGSHFLLVVTVLSVDGAKHLGQGGSGAPTWLAGWLACAAATKSRKSYCKVHKWKKYWLVFNEARGEINALLSYILVAHAHATRQLGLTAQPVAPS